MVKLLGTTIWKFLIKVNIYLCFDTATTLPSIYPGEIKAYIYIYIKVSIHEYSQ